MAQRLTMDYNYLNMEPEGLESVELQDRMIEEFGISSDFALITAETLDEVQYYLRKSKRHEHFGNGTIDS